MNLAEYLSQECVVFLVGKTKAAALDELIERVATTKRIPDREALREAVFHREELMSTGIGLGIGVPHVRLDRVGDPCVAVGIHRAGIGDYESLDGEPVHVLVLIVAGKTQHALYIRLLSTVTSLLKSGEVRDRLLAAETPEAVYEILTESADA